MNKIVLNDKYEEDINNSIIVKNDNGKLNITFMENSSLILELYNNINLDININSNVEAKLYIIKQENINNIIENYNLLENSYLNIKKFNDVLSIDEDINISLNGLNSKIDYDFKTISKNIENYNLKIMHNYSKTNANISNKGINISNGLLTFDVSAYIENGKTACKTSQNNQIINETNNKCMIKPKLYISEYDVEASHSAHIGTFDENVLFYLKSRGIEENEAKKLLIKGFLLNNLEEIEIANNIILKYWR